MHVVIVTAAVLLYLTVAGAQGPPLPPPPPPPPPSSPYGMYGPMNPYSTSSSLSVVYPPPSNNMYGGPYPSGSSPGGYSAPSSPGGYPLPGSPGGYPTVPGGYPTAPGRYPSYGPPPMSTSYYPPPFQTFSGMMPMNDPYSSPSSPGGFFGGKGLGSLFGLGKRR